MALLLTYRHLFNTPLNEDSMIFTHTHISNRKASSQQYKSAQPGRHVRATISARPTHSLSASHLPSAAWHSVHRREMTCSQTWSLSMSPAISQSELPMSCSVERMFSNIITSNQQLFDSVTILNYGFKRIND